MVFYFILGVAQKKDKKQDGSLNETGKLPIMDPFERYMCSLSHLNEVITRNKTLNDTISAQEVRSALKKQFFFLHNKNNIKCLVVHVGMCYAH